MRLNKGFIVLIFLSFCISCSREENKERQAKVNRPSKIDQSKFDDIYRNAKTIEGSIAVGIDYKDFQQLLQNLATQILIAKDKINSEEERKLLDSYSGALTMYLDSSELWNIDMVEYGSYGGQVPKVEAILKKYGLPTEGIEMRANFHKQLEDSLKVIWTKAQDELEKANTILRGKGT